MLKVSYFPSKLSLIFIGFFKYRRAHPCMSILALAFLLTQTKIVSEGETCKAGANFPNIPKNFFI